MKEFLIKTEPQKETYILLMDFLLKPAAYFQLVVHDTLELSNEGMTLLERLKDDLVYKSSSSMWPGTVLLNDRKAEVYRYRLTQTNLEQIKSATNHLFGWMQPDLPEDISFFREDGSLLFAVISHEEDAFFEFQENEKDLEDFLYKNLFI